MSSPGSSDSELQRAMALSLSNSKSSPAAKHFRRTESAESRSDSDLQKAIALSLETVKSEHASDQARKMTEVINLCDSDDEETSRKPMAEQAKLILNSGLAKSESRENNSRRPSQQTGYISSKPIEKDNIRNAETQNKITTDSITDVTSLGEERRDGSEQSQLNLTNMNPYVEYLPSSAASSSKRLPAGSPYKPEILQRTIASPRANRESRGVTGLGLFDRKKMEEERLARMAKKRKASPISPPPLSRRPMKQSEFSESGSKSNIKAPISVSACSKSMASSEGAMISVSGDFEAPILSSGSHTASKTTLPGEVPYTQQRSLLEPGLHFPNGIVKKTWAQGYPRQDDIKIEEVLQKKDLEFAVLSSYIWDTEWVITKLNLAETKLICVIQAESEEEKIRMRENVPPNIRFCFPSMAGQISCMHSKLQMLAHPTHLRVVVSSANLVPCDWGETGGIIENMVFMIDLPRLENIIEMDEIKSTPFHRELIHFLKAMGMEQSVIDSTFKFDFAQTNRFAFVHSIGGSHTGLDWKRTGYCGLGSAIQGLGLARNEPLSVDFVSASLGSLNIDFIKSIYLAAQGDNGMRELNSRLNLSSRIRTSHGPTNRNSEDEKLQKEVETRFRIYFPTRDTVVESKGGIESGGTVCFQSKWFDSPNFPTSLMRDCKSQRPGTLMHNKIMFARPDQPLRGKDNVNYAGWAYVGSANLSQSAWGHLVKDKSSKQQPKMNCRNWECGVVIPVPTRQMAGDRYCGELEAVFEGVVPVPMVVPGEDYGGRRPWFFLES